MQVGKKKIDHNKNATQSLCIFHLMSFLARGPLFVHRSLSTPIDI